MMPRGDRFEGPHDPPREASGRPRAGARVLADGVRGHRRSAARGGTRAPHGPPGQFGFTLLEIAVALSILGVGIVSCLQIFGASLRLADRATRETAAVREARAAMDAMLARPPDAFVEDVGREIKRTTEEGLMTKMSSWAEPTDEREFGTHQAQTHRLYHVFVSVSWQDGRGMKTYSLESLRMAPENE